MTKTIVTGSSGFIGSHLVKKLDDVLIFDHKDIECGYSYNADRMFFLSTYGNMASHSEVPWMVRANVGDLLSVLCDFRGWCCFMSSSSVMLPVQTPYSRTKRAAEEILQAWIPKRSCIVRPYSVTGVGEQKEHLIPTLIRSCMEGEEMPFDPYPIHDFIDVEDVVDSLIRMSELQSTGIFELGMGFPVDNKRVKEMVEVTTGKKANIILKPNLRPYDNFDWYCKDFYRPFKPKKPLSLSIFEMVEAYKHEHA